MPKMFSNVDAIAQRLNKISVDLETPISDLWDDFVPAAEQLIVELPKIVDSLKQLVIYIKNNMICKECGCTTGGGQYCYQHAPYTVTPLKDGTYYVDRNGQRTHVLDPIDALAIQDADDDTAWEPSITVPPVERP